jgi:PAS domain-containing protein
MSELLAEADIWRSVLDELPVAVSISTAIRDGSGAIVDFRTEYVNHRSSEVSGIPAAEQIGRLASEMLPNFREMQLFEDTVRVVETGESMVREQLAFDEVVQGNRRVQGTFEIEARKFRDGILSVSRDVTERKDAEARLGEARAEIQQRRFAQRQIVEINDRIIASLVEATAALDTSDLRGAKRAIQQTLSEASKIITDLRALPQAR